MFINSLQYTWWEWSNKISWQWNIFLLGYFLLINFIWIFKRWIIITIPIKFGLNGRIFSPFFFMICNSFFGWLICFSIFSLLLFKIDFSLFFQNRRLFELPISIHPSLVIFDNYSGVNLETTLEKGSFSVETWLDSTPIEEGDEGFYFDCNSGKDLNFSSC